jgi:predicted exporter
MHLAAQQASERAQRLAALIVRRPWSILAVALIVGVAALWLALGLRVDQQLRALLPDDAISTTRIDAMSERLGNQSDLYVEIRSPSREANLRFGERFAAELRQRADLRHVHFHLSRDFFEENALLYAELADLLDLRCRVIEAVQAQVRREMALLGDDDDPVPQLSEPELRERYQRGARLPEYYEADEGRVVVIKARPTRPDTDIAFARALSRELAAAAAAAEPAAYHPDMVVEIEGAYAEHTRKVSGLEGDIVRGSAIVFGLLMLSLAVYFRGLRAIVLVLLPLAIAILTALAAARLFYGALNLVSAFIFAVLLGLGVDFGIHILARYQAERRRGLALTPALALTFTTTGLSTAAGALSTALTCFLLLVADFRGFSHFGVIAGLGVTLSLVGAVLVLPAALVVLERRWPWRTTQRPPPEPPPAAAAEQTPPRFPRLAAVIVALGVGAAALAANNLDALELETDLGRLEDPVRAAPAPPSKAPLDDYRAAVGASALAPAVVLAADRREARAAYQQLAALARLDAAEAAALARGAELPPPPPLDACGRPAPADPDALADEEEPDEGDDRQDPAFIALGAAAAAARGVASDVLRDLRAYPGPRLIELHDRLREVAAIDAYVPDLQEEKLAVIRDLRRRIDGKLGALSPADRERVATWRPYLEVDRPIEADDLPDWVRASFTDARGELGGYVVFWTKGGKSDYRNAKRVYDAYRELHVAGREVPVAASFFVIPEIVDLIRADGPLVIGLAFAVLLALALLLFRSAGAALVIFVTVACALLWLGGLIAAFGWKVNFFNVIAFPLLIGMGQDDAVHLLHRHREGGHLATTLRETGGAIFMTTLTTTLGYGGMLFADHLGLFSLGFTAAAGMLLCLLASVVLLPAGLQLAAWLRHIRAARRR